ncbi:MULTISPECIES: phage holin, lambda family [Dickeya]|nr:MULTISPECIES: phage holin, lambda family [Dickeya]WFN55996.1 phage holin, lambda family [Dickeya lacustris]
MKMQNNVHTWTDFWDLLRMWWNGDMPLGGVLLSILITVLRVAYMGGGHKKMLLEAALCGALTLTVISSLEYFSLPRTLTVAIGGSIGFIGVEQIRTLALRILGNRFGGNNPQA